MPVWLRRGLLVMALSLTTARADKLTVAVNTFQPRGVDESSVLIITDRICSELFQSGLFTVVERSEMEAVLKEQGFQQAACASDACAVEMGQLLGVQYMITGSIGKIGKMYTISMRMIDVATGKIAEVASADCKCEIDDFLTEATPKAVRTLAAAARKTIVGEEPGTVTAPASGTLVILTQPEGASVQAGGERLGLTPLERDDLRAGPYRLELTLSGYEPVEEEVTVESGARIERSYTLKPVEKPATLSAGSPESPRKRRVVPKVLLGVAAAGSGAAGLLLNLLAQGDIDEAEAVKSAYVTGGNNDQYYQHAADYESYTSAAQSKAIAGDILYGVAGLATIGFGISFAF